MTTFHIPFHVLSHGLNWTFCVYTILGKPRPHPLACWLYMDGFICVKNLYRRTNWWLMKWCGLFVLNLERFFFIQVFIVFTQFNNQSRSLWTATDKWTQTNKLTLVTLVYYVITKWLIISLKAKIVKFPLFWKDISFFVGLRNPCFLSLPFSR